MKTKLLSIIVLLASVSGMMAQAPQMFNYQAIARDASGNAIANKQISVRFTMHNLTASGEVVYQGNQLLSNVNLVCLQRRLAMALTPKPAMVSKISIGEPTQNTCR